ncbi:hypothetical protein [Roseibium sp. Sym1]|uniref:hypothetical protein n=1 Tax=Roseibium sp. Sym1 TaxID=3016006 RepID=UPI0022B4F0B1|nr:hypothetical protein [Roseibium sp. Sym1]
MSETEPYLPSNLSAIHVIGVTPADHHLLSRQTIPGFLDADLVGHPNHSFTRHGKIRPTVYFANGSRFTQSHVKEHNIGYHPPSGQHLFFGNVDQDEFWRRRADLRTFRAYLDGFTDPSGRPSGTPPPRLGESFEGRMLLEIKEGSIHPSRSALVSVSYQQAVQLVRAIRARTGEKRKFSPTQEWYFGEAPFG